MALVLVILQIGNLRLIKQFVAREPKSEAPLGHWETVTVNASWNNAADVFATFPKADLVGKDKWIFNIGGNNFRLAAAVWFQSKTVYILKIMTHKEYDNEVW